MSSRKKARDSKPKLYSTRVSNRSDTEDEGKLMEKTQLLIPDSNPMAEPRGLEGDRSNVAILLFLYILQGIPLGLAGSLPLVLQGYKISYKQQAMLSFIFWPFSIKLLWAPIVDAVFISRLGRRKSWLVPTQYLIGATMMLLSGNVKSLLGEKGSDLEPNVLALTVSFFFLNFLAATQDIAVDGWALTMLSKRNLGYASTCNSVGQTAGYFLGNVVFLAFESAEFCNSYIRSEPADEGLFTLADFLFFWGVVFIFCTTLVLFFKHERKDEEEDSIEGVFGTFKQLHNILKLGAVKQYILICLTIKIGFTAADSVTGLKLIEAGVPKEKLAMMAVPLVPIQIILPWMIAKYTAGPRPLDIMLKAMPFRLMMGIVFMFIVHQTPLRKLENGDFPLSYYFVILLSYGCHQVTLYCMFVASMAFHSKISDPLIGGTYITLLNTVTNLGGNWPATVALWFIDFLTFRSCYGAGGEYDCDTKKEEEVCLKAGGVCNTDIDGYYVESIVCLIIGILWFRLLSKKTRQLQDLDESEWRLSTVIRN